MVESCVFKAVFDAIRMAGDAPVMKSALSAYVGIQDGKLMGYSLGLPGGSIVDPRLKDDLMPAVLLKAMVELRRDLGFDPRSEDLAILDTRVLGSGSGDWAEEWSIVHRPTQKVVKAHPRFAVADGGVNFEVL